MAQGQVDVCYAFAQQPRAVSAHEKFRDPGRNGSRVQRKATQPGFCAPEALK